jgi:hypothetical protein
MKLLAALMCALFACTAYAQDTGKRTISYDFIDVKVELTVDSWPTIHRLRILLWQKDGGFKPVVDQTDFTNWKGGTRYGGLIQVGRDLDIITWASGTGVGAQFLNKYRIRDGKAAFIKSEKIFQWSLDSMGRLQIDKKKALIINYDKKHPWTIWFDTE